jgi:hypothetical protein
MRHRVLQGEPRKQTMDSSGSQSERFEHSLTGDETTLGALLEHQRAWETFATESIHMIPMLKAQMTAVTQETERAAMELLASSEGVASSKDDSASLSKVVMTMQFQDITRQKLEHVGLALDRLKAHLEALLKGPGDEEAKKEIAALELVEQHYTTEEERRLHAAALGPDYGEPVPMDMSNKEPDSVTLF